MVSKVLEELEDVARVALAGALNQLGETGVDPLDAEPFLGESALMLGLERFEGDHHRLSECRGEGSPRRQQEEHRQIVEAFDG